MGKNDGKKVILKGKRKIEGVDEREGGEILGGLERGRD
jgi:hypothetical protein